MLRKMFSWYWGVSAVLVLADQVTKACATDRLSMWQPTVILPDYFSFQLVHNFGAAYGLFQHHRWPLLAVGAVVLLICIFFRNQLAPTRVSRWGVAFLFAGTLGNFLDRLRLGYVVDFIDIRIFPVFNLADVFIDIGLALFLLDMILEGIKQRRSTPEA